MQQGGLGHPGQSGPNDGNPELIRRTGRRFLPVRYGSATRSPIEGTAQRVAIAFRWSGIVARLGQSLVAALSGASSDGSLGYELRAHRPMAALVGPAPDPPTLRRDFGSSSHDDEYDHYLGVRNPNPHRILESVRHRAIGVGPIGSADFVLPALSWQPTGEPFLRLYPDLQGRYLGNLVVDRSTARPVSRSGSCRGPFRISGTDSQQSAIASVQLGADASAPEPSRTASRLPSAPTSILPPAPPLRRVLMAGSESGTTHESTIGFDPGLILNLEAPGRPVSRAVSAIPPADVTSSASPSISALPEDG